MLSEIIAFAGVGAPSTFQRRKSNRLALFPCALLRVLSYLNRKSRFSLTPHLPVEHPSRALFRPQTALDLDSPRRVRWRKCDCKY
jgi:hypothetical protein